MWRNEQGWHRIRRRIRVKEIPGRFPRRCDAMRSWCEAALRWSSGFAGARRSGHIDVLLVGARPRPCCSGRPSKPPKRAAISRPARASRRPTSAGRELPVAEPVAPARRPGGGRVRPPAGNRAGCAGPAGSGRSGGWWCRPAARRCRDGETASGPSAARDRGRSRRDRAAAGRRRTSRPGSRARRTARKQASRSRVVHQVLDAVEGRDRQTETRPRRANERKSARRSSARERRAGDSRARRRAARASIGRERSRPTTTCPSRRRGNMSRPVPQARSRIGPGPPARRSAARRR